MSQPRIIKNYNLIIDGFSQRHLCTTVTLPDFTMIVEQHRAGGMDSDVDVEMGVEQMTLTASIAERSENLAVLVGRGNQNSVGFQLRASMTGDTGDETPYIVTGRGMMRRIGGGDLQAGQKSEMEVELSCRYYKLVQGQRTIHEIDVDNFIRAIDGFDWLAQRRAILFG